MQVKATWIGDGEPEGGVTEYGAGTDNPKIPWGVFASQKSAEPNWEFTHVPEQSDYISFLGKPVFFYATEQGAFYTANEDDVPSGVEYVEGTVADLYRISNRKEQIHPTRGTIHTDKKKFKELQAICDTAVKVAGRVRQGNIKVAREEGGASLVNLYYLAAALNKEYVMGKIEGLKKSKDFDFSLGDLLGPQLAGMVERTYTSDRGSKGGEGFLEDLFLCENTYEINHLIAGLAAKYHELVHPDNPKNVKAPQSVPTKPQETQNLPPPPASFKPQPVAPASTEPKTASDFNEDGPFKFIPEASLKNAFDSLDEKTRDEVAKVIPFFALGKAIFKNGGVFSALRSIPVIKKLVDKSHAGHDTKFGATPIFLANFPFQVTDKKAMAEGISAEFKLRLEMEVGKQLEDFSSVHPSVIQKVMSEMTPGALLKQETGLRDDELQSRLRTYLLQNYTLSRNLSTVSRMGENTGVIYNTVNQAWKSLTGRTKGTMNDSHMQHLDDNFDSMFELLVGGKPEALFHGDMTGFEGSDGKLMSLSYGTLRAVSKFLPFYKKEGRIVFVDENGKDLPENMTPEARKGVYGRILALQKTPLSHQAVLSNLLRQYQETVYEKFPKAASLFGQKKKIEHLPIEESLFADKAASIHRANAASSLTSYLISGIEGEFVKVTPRGLDAMGSPDEFKAFMREKFFQLDDAEIMKAFNVSNPEFAPVVRQCIEQCVDRLVSAHRDKIEGSTHMGHFGFYLEPLGFIPALAGILDTMQGQSVSIDFKDKLEISDISGDAHGTSGSTFLDHRAKASGFVITSSGSGKSFLLKEDRTNGYGDMIYFNPANKTGRITPIEVKILEEGTNIPHMTYVSPFLKYAMHLAKDCDTIQFGDAAVFSLNYSNRKTADKPFSTMGQPKNGEFFRGKLALADTMSQFVDAFSQSDGTGLSGVRA